MEFSWFAAIVTFLVWLIQAILSSRNGAFSRGQTRQLRMPFLWNWAISIGIPIFAVINGLVVPHFRPSNSWYFWVPAWFLVSFVTTCLLYQNWQFKNENRGHIFTDDWKITIAGRLHSWYTPLQAVVLGMYIVSSMDRTTILLVSFLFTIFLGIQNLQAVIVQGARPRWAIRQFAWQFAVVIVVTAIKSW